MSLRGEYIWDGSYLIGADTETDDMGHEAYIMSQIAGTYGEDFTNALEEEHDRLSQLNDQQLPVDPIYKKLQQEGYDIDDVENLVDKLKRYGIEHIDPELIHDAYQMLKAMHPEQYSTPEIIDAMNVLKGGDARYYGVKNYGYTIIRDDNFEVYGWNEKAAKSILNAIYEIAGEELNDPNSEVWDEEITIHDYQNDKSYTMTIRELEEKPFKLAATPAALVQSKKHGMQYINPIASGGSQNWQKQYTSENFSTMNFKLWLTEAEYKDLRNTYLESVEIRSIDPEEDWEDAEKAQIIANLSGIRPGRDKEPTILAYDENGNVVGAAFTNFAQDHDSTEQYGEPIHQFQFDVVVHPKARGTDLVGIKLIRAAEQEKKHLESEFGKTFSRLWVVNPKLAKLLQTKKFNYESESEHEDGSAHLLKW